MIKYGGNLGHTHYFLKVLSFELFSNKEEFEKSFKGRQ